MRSSKNPKALLISSVMSFAFSAFSLAKTKASICGMIWLISIIGLYSYPFNAAAPLTISVNSVVMAA